MVGVQLVEAFAGFARQDACLGALCEHLVRLLERAGHAVDAGQVDGAVLDAVGDQVAVLDEGDGAAGSSLRADMADRR